MAINISHEAITSPLVEQKSNALVRVLAAIWHSDVLWALWLAIRFALCLAAIWYGMAFTQNTARNDLDAVAMAFMVGAVITVALSPKRDQQ